MNQFLNKVFYKVSADTEAGILNFYAITGEYFSLYHNQDCCESVYIESISGNLDNLVDSPILRADEKVHQSESEYGSCTATFYTFATAKGYVDVRFNGESNGYYSESVDFHSDTHPVPADILATYKLSHPELFL